MIYCCQKAGGSPTSFWEELAPKNTLNLKNWASLADKAIVSLSPKILQLGLRSEMFSAKSFAEVNLLIEFSQLARFLKEQV